MVVLIVVVDYVDCPLELGRQQDVYKSILYVQVGLQSVVVVGAYHLHRSLNCEPTLSMWLRIMAHYMNEIDLLLGTSVAADDVGGDVEVSPDCSGCELLYLDSLSEIYCYHYQVHGTRNLLECY